MWSIQFCPVCSFSVYILICLMLNDARYACCQAFNMLHLMHHEATACHVTDDIVVLLTLMTQILDSARKCITDKKCTYSSVNVTYRVEPLCIGLRMADGKVFPSNVTVGDFGIFEAL